MSTQEQDAFNEGIDTIASALDGAEVYWHMDGAGDVYVANEDLETARKAVDAIGLVGSLS